MNSSVLKSVCRSFCTKGKPIPVLSKPTSLDISQLHTANMEQHKILGPIYAEQLGPDANVVWIADPKMCETILRNDGKWPRHVVPSCWQVYNEKVGVKRGLFFLDGEEWLKMRKGMNPIFLKAQGVEIASPLTGQVTGSLVQDWKSLINSENNNCLTVVEVPDITSMLHRWSVESVLASLFGSFKDCMMDIDQFVRDVHTMFEESANLQTQSSLEAWEKQTQDWQRFCAASKNVLEVVHSLTFSQLSLSKSEAECLTGQLAKVFDKQEIARIAVDLVIAAADTTSYSTLWTLHLLASHKQEQENLLLHTNCGNNKMNYARWCTKESMRLYPVAPFLTRILTQPLEVDGGYRLEQGQLVLISMYSMGRDETYFKQPLRFWPERWQRLQGSNKMSAVSNAFASLPFSFGVRSCIGKKLAENQMEHLIKALITNFELVSLNETPVNLTLKLIGLPDQPIRIAIKSRLL